MFYAISLISIFIFLTSAHRLPLIAPEAKKLTISEMSQNVEPAADQIEDALMDVVSLLIILNENIT